MGGMSDGNELLLYIEGDAAFDAMLAAIRHARHRIWLETYILEQDSLGNRVLHALADAAGRGVEVVLLFDALGSSSISDDALLLLRSRGGRVAAFNPLLSLPRPLPATMRDHRKILVIDDSFGFCGGMNISADYAGPRLGNGRFRDTHLGVAGPAVWELASLFASSFLHATGERLAPGPAMKPRPAGARVQVLGSDQRRRKRHIQRSLQRVVEHAAVRVWLTTPYFIPPPRVLAALGRAASRGVDVRILTAGVSDVPLAASAARHLYGRLLEHGVRIFEFKSAVLHAKTAVVDGSWASVGSFNLDRWSYERNLEVAVMALDTGFAADLEEVFLRDLRTSEEVHLEAWRRRSVMDAVAGFVSYHLARL